MAKISLDQLTGVADRGTLVLESMQNALYQAYFELDGETFVITDNGAPVRAFSVGKMYERLGGFRFHKALLRQNSAYDEMIGQPMRDSNTLVVPLDWSESAFLMP